MGQAPPDIPPFFSLSSSRGFVVSRFSNHGECRALTSPPNNRLAAVRKATPPLGRQKKAPNRLG